MLRDKLSQCHESLLMTHIQLCPRNSLQTVTDPLPTIQMNHANLDREYMGPYARVISMEVFADPLP
jgi:hypothetical protein